MADPVPAGADPVWQPNVWVQRPSFSWIAFGLLPGWGLRGFGTPTAPGTIYQSDSNYDVIHDNWFIRPGQTRWWVYAEDIYPQEFLEHCHGR